MFTILAQTGTSSLSSGRTAGGLEKEGQRIERHLPRAMVGRPQAWGAANVFARRRAWRRCAEACTPWSRAPVESSSNGRRLGVQGMQQTPHLGACRILAQRRGVNGLFGRPAAE